MQTSGLGEHHLHVRKRVYKNLEPYPHPDKMKALFDKLAYLVALGVVAMTLPQVLQVWVGKNASGLSMITWLSLAAGNVFWVVYALLHKEKVVLAANGAALVLNAMVVAGIFVYGGH